jgi:hypothetical protein
MGSALFLAAIMTAFVLPEHADTAEDAQQGCECTSLTLAGRGVLEEHTYTQHFDPGDLLSRNAIIKILNVSHILFKLLLKTVFDPIKHLAKRV